jgi:hypothetical protein
LWLPRGELDAQYFEGAVVKEILDVLLVQLVEIYEAELVYSYLVDLRAEVFELLSCQLVCTEIELLQPRQFSKHLEQFFKMQICFFGFALHAIHG